MNDCASKHRTDSLKSGPAKNFGLTQWPLYGNNNPKSAMRQCIRRKGEEIHAVADGDVPRAEIGASLENEQLMFTASVSYLRRV